VFVTMEDETGPVNVIVWPDLVEKQRKELLGASLLGVYGIWQCERDVRPGRQAIGRLVASAWAARGEQQGFCLNSGATTPRWGIFVHAKTGAVVLRIESCARLRPVGYERRPRSTGAATHPLGR
jgi:hypothetical protein